MQDRLEIVIAAWERLVVWIAAAGAAVVLVQMVWISYGVLVRYAMGKPDRMVTEATALLLFPVAFAGLAYAMREDAYPRVTLLTDLLPERLRAAVQIINRSLMVAVGAFFCVATVSATVRSFQSGSASEILQWPRYLLWAPGAGAMILFTIYAALRLARLLLRARG